MKESLDTARNAKEYLKSKKIEARPIEGGNMAEQPGMKYYDYKTVGELENSRLIMRNGLFLPNHHLIQNEHRKYMVSCILDYLEGIAN